MKLAEREVDGFSTQHVLAPVKWVAEVQRDVLSCPPNGVVTVLSFENPDGCGDAVYLCEQHMPMTTADESMAEEPSNGSCTPRRPFGRGSSTWIVYRTQKMASPTEGFELLVHVVVDVASLDPAEARQVADTILSYLVTAYASSPRERAVPQVWSSKSNLVLQPPSATNTVAQPITLASADQRGLFNDTNARAILTTWARGVGLADIRASLAVEAPPERGLTAGARHVLLASLPLEPAAVSLCAFWQLERVFATRVSNTNGWSCEKMETAAGSVLARGLTCSPVPQHLPPHTVFLCYPPCWRDDAAQQPIDSGESPVLAMLLSPRVGSGQCAVLLWLATECGLAGDPRSIRNPQELCDAAKSTVAVHLLPTLLHTFMAPEHTELIVAHQRELVVGVPLTAAHGSRFEAITFAACPGKPWGSLGELLVTCTDIVQRVPSQVDQPLTPNAGADGRYGSPLTLLVALLRDYRSAADFMDFLRVEYMNECLTTQEIDRQGVTNPLTEPVSRSQFAIKQVTKGAVLGANPIGATGKWLGTYAQECGTGKLLVANAVFDGVDEVKDILQKWQGIMEAFVLKTLA